MIASLSDLINYSRSTQGGAGVMAQDRYLGQTRIKHTIVEAKRRKPCWLGGLVPALLPPSDRQTPLFKTQSVLFKETEVASMGPAGDLVKMPSALPR